jgi:hypothetical protein
MKITLIAPTYKRNDICNRLINSVPDWINIVVVSLSDSSDIIRKSNVYIKDTNQMPLTNAYNLGAEVADIVYPDTELYLFTDDDVYFTEHTVIDDFIFSLLAKKDTGLVSITRIINSIKRTNVAIQSNFVYKGGGWFIKKDVFYNIGKFTPNNSVDEWDICTKSFINGYKNYRTRSCYAYHKQGTSKGGYKQALKENANLGNSENDILKYVNTEIVTVAGYEYFSGKKTKFNKLAIQMHNSCNIKLNYEKG